MFAMDAYIPLLFLINLVIIIGLTDICTDVLRNRNLPLNKFLFPSIDLKEKVFVSLSPSTYNFVIHESFQKNR